MVILTFASVGLPGLSGFAGEFLILLGLFQRGWAESGVGDSNLIRVYSVLGVVGIILGAWYMLYLVRKVFFGPLKEPKHGPNDPPIRDIGLRETAALMPLMVFIFWIGLQPNYFLARLHPTVTQLSANARLAAAKSAPGETETAVKQSKNSTGDLARVH